MLVRLRPAAIGAALIVCVGSSIGIITAGASKVSAHKPTVSLVGMPSLAAAGSAVLVGMTAPKGATCLLLARGRNQQVATTGRILTTTHAEWSWTIPKQVAPGRWTINVRCRIPKTMSEDASTAQSRSALIVTGRSGDSDPIFLSSAVHFAVVSGDSFRPGKGAGTPPAFGYVELAGSSWLGGHGVTIYSNGPDWKYSSNVWNYVNGKLSGMKWQCVEMVDRLIITLGWAPSGITGNAVQFWANAPSAYFVQHPNGSSYSPVPGDIVVFHDPDNQYGHVAVVDTVSSGSIVVGEENASSSGLSTLSWNGSTLGNEGSEVPTGFLHPKADTFSDGSGPAPSPKPEPIPTQAQNASGVGETVGGPTNTWTDYTSGGGSEGAQIPNGTTVQVGCRISGLAVSDGNVWWYEINSSPWDGNYFASADAFYNNGATSGSLQGTPLFDNGVPLCAGAKAPPVTTTTEAPTTTPTTATTTPPTTAPTTPPTTAPTTPPTTAPTTPPTTAPTTYSETVGGPTNTWTNYSNAGGSEGQQIPSGMTVQVTCKVPGFRVADGDTWWYQIASSPWNNSYYASADAFYNDGATSGSLQGTPFVDSNVSNC